ncbi:pectinesterase 31 isoform X1 [Carex littledalei]|uniref:Pectinesterase n=1 Tax=Carex littledalei TaxID=544730 RepID=A0A833QX27_9POAL|nr:pectinesterase 31 isoform X1 [Carex littledalei]
MMNYKSRHTYIFKRVVRVAANGTGDYAKVQDAIDSVPLNNCARTTILIFPGVYREPVYVPKTKNLITFRGILPETTIISWDNTHARINHHQPPDVIGTGTFACGTVIVEGEDFIAENVTFENSAPEGSEQAVAFRITAKRCALYNCRFLGWQDTLYLHHGKQYLRDCYIEGSVDFIFGNSTALLEHCHIHCKAPGFITAHGRKTCEEETAYVFLRVVFAYSWIDACVNPAGWCKWDGSENEKTACFCEYRCFGPGCSACCGKNRVTWCRELPDEEAEQFLSLSFLDSNPKEPWLIQQATNKILTSA